MPSREHPQTEIAIPPADLETWHDSAQSMAHTLTLIRESLASKPEDLPEVVAQLEERAWRLAAAVGAVVEAQEAFSEESPEKRRGVDAPQSLLSARFEAALAFAARLHAGQTRKGTAVPYVSHPLAVCSLVLENGGGEDAVIAALLHDAAEDRGGQATLDDISRLFGERVASLVAECSDTLLTPKPPWRARKEEFLAQLPSRSDDARLISAADKVHNARCILTDYLAVGEPLWQRFTGGRDGTLWYYRSLVEVLTTSGPQRLADQLRGIVAELDRAVAAAR